MSENWFGSHNVTAVPCVKLSGIIGYSFSCSCGREGNGRHLTAENAIKAGHNHIKLKG